MTPEQKYDERQKLINKTFKELGRTEAAVHVIAENWSNFENERLIKENKELKQPTPKKK